MIYHSPSCFKRQFGTSGRCGQMLLMADNKAIEKLFCGTAFFFRNFVSLQVFWRRRYVVLTDLMFILYKVF